MKIRILLLFILIILSSLVFAQTAPDTLWTKQLSGKRGNSIVQTNNYNFIVVGHKNGSQFFGDVYVIKIDSLGQVIWDTTFNNNNLEDSANSIKKIDNNYFIITGTFNYNPFLTKINSDGDSLWFKSYTNPEFYSSNSVDMDEDGNFAFCGENVVGYIVKTDSLGNQIWSEYYPDNVLLEQSSCNHIQFISDNNLAISGYAAYHLHPGNDWSESYLIKTDNLGNEIFYENFGFSYSTKFVYTNNDEFILITDEKSYKLDSDGNILWDIDLPFYATSIIEDENNYIIAGYDEGNPCVLKINGNGNQLWFAIYNTNTDDFIYDIIKTNDDCYVLTGRSGDNLYIMKLDSEGISNADDLIINNNFKCNNYPNPFNPTTTIYFSIPVNRDVELSIYNMKGQKIKILTEDFFESGNHSVVWSVDDNFGKSVSSGIYLYNLKVNGKTEAVNKCLLLK